MSSQLEVVFCLLFCTGKHATPHVKEMILVFKRGTGNAGCPVKVEYGPEDQIN